MTASKVSHPIAVQAYTSSSESIEMSTMDFQHILREVCLLMKQNIRDFRDTLFAIEELSKKNWDHSVAKQLESMRSWTNTALKLTGVGTAIISAVPHIHPTFIEGALGSLISSANGMVPDLLARFGGDVNQLAKASAKALGSLNSIHGQFDQFNQTRLKADETEHSSGAQAFQDLHQKNASYRQEYIKKTQDIIDQISSLERSILQSIQSMVR